MKHLYLKTFAGFFAIFAIMTAAIFLSAWTLAYWQGWVFLAIFFVPCLTITVYLMKKDPKLLERRITAGPTNEERTSQKIIQFIAQIAFLLLLILPALDYRFGWSTVPAYVSVVGDVLIVIGFYIVFLVFKENTFASALIEVDSSQKVISTGPYAWVRHPMYIGGIILIWGTPLALASWWGISAAVLLTAVIVWRLLDEERFLAKSLPGYIEYKNKVRYRLLPLLW